MRVGFLGLGRMGRPMAANLVAAGFDVTVWNRTAAKAHAFVREVGGKAAATPAEAAVGRDVVVGMLADDAAVRSTWLGPGEGQGGAVAALEPGAVAIESGTISPPLAREVAEAAAKRGAAFLDAPVSGSTAAARDAELTLMVGGEADALERARPVLAAMGTPLLHLGPIGAGAAMKLAVNGIVHSLNQAVAEALAAAEGAGIEADVAYGVLESSAIAAPMLGYRKQQYLDPAHAPVTFALRLAAKDVRLLLDLAAEVGAAAPQAEANLAALQAAIDAGYGEADMAEIRRWIQNRPPTRGGDAPNGRGVEP